MVELGVVVSCKVKVVVFDGWILLLGCVGSLVILLVLFLVSVGILVDFIVFD